MLNVPIFENLTTKQMDDLFLMHYGTEEYNSQPTVYGYQFSVICRQACNPNFGK